MGLPSSKEVPGETTSNERGTRCARKGAIEALCSEAQVPMLGLRSWGPFLLHPSRVARPLEWGLPITHLGFPSPTLGKALLEGACGAMASREGSGPTAATSSKGALCAPGREPCPCPPASIQLALGLLSWEQQLSLVLGLPATRARCLSPSSPALPPWLPPH